MRLLTSSVKRCERKPTSLFFYEHFSLHCFIKFIEMFYFIVHFAFSVNIMESIRVIMSNLYQNTERIPQTQQFKQDETVEYPADKGTG